MRHAQYWALGLCFLALGLTGCGNDPKYVAVSGVVKVNGKPYKNAVVTFQPMGSKENINPGRGSSGITDDQGRFTLKTDGGQNGAVVGTHLVRIMTDFKTLGAAQNDGDPNNPAKVLLDPIPDEWHSKSQKTFDVPAGGTDAAVFEITGKKK